LNTNFQDLSPEPLQKRPTTRITISSLALLLRVELWLIGRQLGGSWTQLVERVCQSVASRRGMTRGKEKSGTITTEQYISRRMWNNATLLPLFFLFFIVNLVKA
jgi:hypothetical protein